MAMKRSYVGYIREVLEPITADQVSKRKDGTIVIRRGFYYRHGQDAEGFRIAVCKALNRTPLKYSIKDYGEKYTTFRGGASLANQSHWWVELWPEQVDMLA